MQTLHFDTVDSTNEVAKRLISEGQIQSLAVITAAHQTAGKGTKGRQWLSPRGAGLYLSIVHPESCYALLSSPYYPLAAGVACAKAIEAVTGYRIQLKPVNDLYAENGKLGGILTEGMYRHEKMHALITGIGINLLETERLLPLEDLNRPVSLENLLGCSQTWLWKPQQLIDAILLHLDMGYTHLFEAKTALILEGWKAYQLSGTELDLSRFHV